MPVSTATSSLPFVTIAVGTYNRARWLREALKFLTHQEYPLDRHEVIVVDNNSTDDTPSVVKEFASSPNPPKYFFEPKPGSSHARNRIIAEARGEIIAFVDDDVMGRTDWLRLLIAPLLQPGNERVAGVGGETIPYFPDGEPSWLHGQFRAFGYRKDTGPLAGKQIPSTANVALRRSVLDEVGGFRTDLGRLPNRLTAGEDNDLMRRILGAGYVFWFEPKADVLHVVPSNRLTFKYHCKLQYDAAASRVIERFGLPGFPAWVTSRIILYFLQIPLLAFVGLVACVIGRTGNGKMMWVRAARAAGYVTESVRVLKRRLCGQPIGVNE